MDDFRLTSAQRRQLRGELERTREARLYRRLLALLEVDQGRPISDVARSLGVTRQSVHHWLRDFCDQPRVETLRDRPRPGRPSLGDDSLREMLHALLKESPREHGYWANVWTVPLLREHLRHARELSLGASTLRRELHELGYTWKRSRYVLTPDPEQEKKRVILRELRHLGPRSVILAEDETDLRLFPPLRASWSPRGAPERVELSGGNAKRVLFGCLNIRTGHRLRLPRRHSRSEDFRELLNLVRRSYRTWKTVLLLDEDSNHTAGASRTLAAAYRVDLQWLPKRSPHLNPMDQLWRYSKGVALANRQEASIDDLVDQALASLDSLSNAETLRKAGLLSRDCWLKSVL